MNFAVFIVQHVGIFHSSYSSLVMFSKDNLSMPLLNLIVGLSPLTMLGPKQNCLRETAVCHFL